MTDVGEPYNCGGSATIKEANQVAHELAKQAMLIKENCICDDDPLVLLFIYVAEPPKL